MNTHTAVYCSLPHGLILSHPMDWDQKVELNGKNKAKIVGSRHGITMVESTFWDEWYALNRDFPAVKSGAIYSAKNHQDGEAIAREFEKRPDGFEGMSQTALGVKPADKDE